MVRYLVRDYGMGSRRKENRFMANAKGVSSKTHTQKQLDDYANQHNPNNKAYRAIKQNQKKRCKKPSSNYYLDDYAPLEWFCYSNPYDFD